jgi:hypothetical protein
MPKYGNDYYVSFTMFWRALIALVRIRDAGVPYYFCHSVEDEDSPPLPGPSPDSEILQEEAGT